MSETDLYEPEFAWSVAWSNGTPRPFILACHTRSTRKDAILSFVKAWALSSERTPMHAWRRAYREGDRCIRVSVSPWGCKSPALSRTSSGE
ncbi:hypothetical protein [Bosea vaviloviae]|uniref:hypothetical protein n=1 Tax=Bosea vaviloviae TaxID=1526658 RepID=UPI000AD28316|nr:hypothetical protein [Bosea vaviloviae]